MSFRKLLLAVVVAFLMGFIGWVIKLDREGMIWALVAGVCVVLMLPVERLDRGGLLELMKAWKGKDGD